MIIPVMLYTSIEICIVIKFYAVPGVKAIKIHKLLVKCASSLSLVGRERVCQTNEPGSNPDWDATVHPVCETFNVMRVI